MIRSPVLSFCLSISMWAPVNSLIAFMLQPPLPMTREMTVDGTDTFLDLLTTSFHPSSLFCPLLGLAMVSFPLGDESGEGPVLLFVDNELLVVSIIDSDNFIDVLEGIFLSSFGEETRTDGFFLLCRLPSMVEE